MTPARTLEQGFSEGEHAAIRVYRSVVAPKVAAPLPQVSVRRPGAKGAWDRHRRCHRVRGKDRVHPHR